MKSLVPRLGKFLLLGGYPIIVYLGLSWFEARKIAFVFILIFLVRFFFPAQSRPLFRKSHITLISITFLGIVIWTNQGEVFLYLPALINFVLLCIFANTLIAPPSMIETFARMQIDELSEEEIQYCQKVTLIWCLFFIMNGVTIIGLAWFTDMGTWTLYTGGLAYFLMGSLIVGEWFYRHWRFRRYEESPWNPLLRRIFPPKEFHEK